MAIGRLGAELGDPIKAVVRSTFVTLHADGGKSEIECASLMIAFQLNWRAQREGRCLWLASTWHCKKADKLFFLPPPQKKSPPPQNANFDKKILSSMQLHTVCV